MTQGGCILPDWPGRMEGDACHDRIADFLLVDIGQGENLTAQIMEQLAAVKQGVLPEWDVSLNETYLQIGPDETVLAPLYPQGTEAAVFRVSTNDLYLALLAWCDQIGSAGSFGKCQPGFG